MARTTKVAIVLSLKRDQTKIRKTQIKNNRIHSSKMPLTSMRTNW